MSFLVYSSSPGFRLPVPRLAPEQLNLGPFVEDEVVGGRLNSLRVPKGDHDLATSIIKVPVDQLPEAVVFIWDGSGAHRPRNLVIFPCPKVLLVASLGPGAKLLSSLVDYIASEKFDRVVAVSGRSQYQLLQAMGIRNLFWFPGLLFPHGDEVVRSAQKQAKEERIAMVGSIERSSSRRQRLGGLLADAAMPLDLEQPGPLDILGFCAKSLITFDALGQGGLTLRIFKAVASGSMVLSERLLAKEQHPLWREGAEWVTFGSPDELLERARYFIGDPPEARRIGERGARWFMEHFNEKRRMAAFQDLVFNGRSLPEFKVPGMAQSANVSWDRRRLEGVLSVRDEVRAAHVAQEAVQVVSDRTLSQDFERLLSSMPRVTVLGAGPEEAEKLAAGAFLLVTSRTTKLSSAVSATHAVWIWDALPEDFAALQGPFSAAGFQAPYAGVCYFRKPAPRRDAPDPLGELARIHLQNGEGAKALEAAMKALAQGSAEAHFVAAEIALERGDGELFTDLLKRARSISPEDPRCALLELHSVRSRRNARETERLLALGWKSAGDHDAPVAMSCARAALKLEPSLVDAHHLGACSALQLRVRGDWKVHGKALQSLQTACELSRGRPDLWHDLAVALRVAGGTVTKAVPAYREALRLDPESATDWFGLGEVLLALDRAD